VAQPFQTAFVFVQWVDCGNSHLENQRVAVINIRKPVKDFFLPGPARVSLGVSWASAIA